MAAFTGNGAYCYANGLHMTFLAAGADPAALPGPGFLECATAMPFGRTYVPAHQVFWPSGPGWSPEQGLDSAIEVLGWHCERVHGLSTEEALAHLQDILRNGPALLGPLDFGYLSYAPGHDHLAGFDHYVTALALDGEQLLVHDPAGFPYAVLPLPDLLAAWRAERIGYKQGPYTLRGRFRQDRQVSRQEVIERTLPLARANVRAAPAGPTSYGGHHALSRLAADVREDVPERLERNLLGFALPTAARRSLDAAGFLAEGHQERAAEIMHRQALLWGQAMSAAARHRWTDTVAILDQLADAEQSLATMLE